MAGVEKSPGEVGWAHASVSVAKRQVRVLQHGSNEALWKAQLRYVYAAYTGGGSPLCSEVMQMMGVEPGATLNQAGRDAVVAWFRTASVPDVPSEAAASRGFVMRTIDKLNELVESEIESLQTSADAAERAEVTRRELAVRAELEAAKPPERPPGQAPAVTGAEEKKAARLNQAKENCKVQGVSFYEWYSYQRLSDEALNKGLEKKPNGYYEAPNCTVQLPSYAELTKAGIYAPAPPGFDEAHTFLLAALRSLYIVLCQPAPKCVTVHPRHDANVISLPVKVWSESEKDYETIEWYPIMDYKAMVHLIELAVPIAYVRDKARRSQYCQDMYHEVVRSLNANSTHTGTAVIFSHELQTAQWRRALIDDLQRQGSSTQVQTSVGAPAFKRQKGESSSAAAKREHPVGVCKWWAGTGACKFSAAECTGGDNPHPEEHKGKFPGAQNWNPSKK